MLNSGWGHDCAVACNFIVWIKVLPLTAFLDIKLLYCRPQRSGPARAFRAACGEVRGHGEREWHFEGKCLSRHSSRPGHLQAIKGLQARIRWAKQHTARILKVQLRPLLWNPQKNRLPDSASIRLRYLCLLCA